jgi:endonuclease-3
MPGSNGRAVEIIKRLKRAYPKAHTALHFKSPVELLVATILSAQCTDERVNKVTKGLFARYHTARDYAGADIAELEQEIRSCGFFRMKARNIKRAGHMIVHEFVGKVPASMEALIKLPGVARKTANIVLGNAFGIVEGIAVDTHVRRVSQRLGLTRNDKPESIEQDLMNVIPRPEWFHFSYLIQTLGRDACTARRMEHDRCVLRDICPSAAGD